MGLGTRETRGMGPTPLSCTLTHLRAKAQRDDRITSRHVDEGSKTRALGHPNPRLCTRHPAARGNVQGLVDPEGKVTATFIGSAQK